MWTVPSTISSNVLGERGNQKHQISRSLQFRSFALYNTQRLLRQTDVDSLLPKANFISNRKLAILHAKQKKALKKK